MFAIFFFSFKQLSLNIWLTGVIVATIPKANF